MSDSKNNTENGNLSAKSTYIGDPKLLIRVKQIICEKYINKPISGLLICEALQKKFNEYKRRKKRPFEKSVEKAINHLIFTESIPYPPDNENDSFSENEKYILYQDSNAVNKIMSNLYKNSPKQEKSIEEVSLSIEKGDNEKPAKKRRKIEVVKKPIELSESTITFDDVGGCENNLLDICRLISHIRHPEVYKQIGVTAPRGLLLHGPPGCGKTLIANAIAGELGVSYIKIAVTEIISGISGGSEERLRDIFQHAIEYAPSILFLDQIDAVIGKTENASKDMEKRIVSQLLTCLDDLSEKESNVLVLGATSRPDSLEPALRRAGRFDHEICLGMPDCLARTKILKILVKNMSLHDDVDVNKIALLTPGFVGADLQSVTREAAILAVHRHLKTPESLDLARIWLQKSQPMSDENLSDLKIIMDDFIRATKLVQPSSKREGFATVPGVSWSDVGALKSVREELHFSIIAPILYSTAWSNLGLKRAAGLLLSGPPGCGKTLLAKAVANEAGLNFLSVKGPELLNMYVGESERGVRQVFQRAKNSAPCVIFFDEVDALCGKRGTRENSESSARLVNQLLTELDGVDDARQKGVYVLAATNRPDILDPALLRPGRLDKVLYVGLPSTEDRLEILKAIVRLKPKLKDDIDLGLLATETNYFSGADLAALIKEASVLALREWLLLSPNNLNDDIKNNFEISVGKKHIDEALKKVKPSVSYEDRIKYNNLEKLCFGIH